jgi:Tfp pilus assembly protein PilO
VSLATVGVLAAYWFWVRPLAIEVASARSSLEETLNKLKASGWPLDSARLESLREQKGKELEQFSKLTEEVLRQATSMFSSKMTMFGGTAEDFRNEVSRLEYQAMYNQFAEKAEQQQVVLSDEVLGLGENTVSPYTYQLVLQLWSLEALVDLALASNLYPLRDVGVRVPNEGGQAQAASQLTVMPIRAYFLNPTDKEPYLLEVPVRLTLSGKLAHFCAFLRALQTDGRFLPVTNLELRKQPSSIGQRQQGGVSDVIQVTLVCSAFVSFHEKAPAAPSPGGMKLLPRGA